VRIAPDGLIQHFVFTPYNSVALIKELIDVGREHSPFSPLGRSVSRNTLLELVVQFGDHAPLPSWKGPPHHRGPRLAIVIRLIPFS
jgi:hypothetical protein